MDKSKMVERLVDRLKNGDKAAFSDLYDLYAPALYGIVLKILRSEQEAQDVVQDSFVKIWKNIHSFNIRKGSLFTWMLNISRNTAIDRLRVLKKDKKVDIDVNDLRPLDSNRHQTTVKTDRIGLKDLVAQLDPKHQLVIEYVYFNGYTMQEISDELGIPLGTVKTRVRSALIALRKVFKLLLFWI